MLFFVCDHSPKQFIDWLGPEAKDICKVSKKPKGIVLFYSYGANKNIIENIKTDARLVVFDGPLTAKSHRANLLDIRTTETPPYYGVEFTKLNRNTWKKPIDCIDEYVRYDHKSAIIRAIEDKSLLNALMTAIYVLPASSQKQVKIAVINWLYYDGNPNNASTLLHMMAERTRISKNSIDRLIEIMCSELAQVYNEALQYTDDVKIVAKKFDISDYDLRYMDQIKLKKSEYQRLIKGNL